MAGNSIKCMIALGLLVGCGGASPGPAAVPAAVGTTPQAAAAAEPDTTRLVVEARLLLLGEGVQQDRVAAGALFTTACQRGALRACRTLMYLGSVAAPVKTEALQALWTGCLRGDAYGCHVFARHAGHAAETGYEIRPPVAKAVLEQKCRAGMAVACTLLVADDATSDAGADLLLRGCELGDPDACATLYGRKNADPDRQQLVREASRGTRRPLEVEVLVPAAQARGAELACRLGVLVHCAGLDDFSGVNGRHAWARAAVFYAHECQELELWACARLRAPHPVYDAFETQRLARRLECAFDETRCEYISGMSYGKNYAVTDADALGFIEYSCLLDLTTFPSADQASECVRGAILASRRARYRGGVRDATAVSRMLRQACSLPRDAVTPRELRLLESECAHPDRPSDPLPD